MAITSIYYRKSTYLYKHERRYVYMKEVELMTSLRLIKVMYFGNEINENTYLKIREKYKEYIDFLPLKTVDGEVMNNDK